jgi:aldehyde dehydrogenase (NAD+)
MTAIGSLTKDPVELLKGHGLYIDGERVGSTSAGAHQHINPATGKVQAQVALAGPDDVDRAVRSACAARASWRAVPPNQKARILARTADLIDEKSEELNILNALETGQPFRGASPGGLATTWIRYYAGWCDKLDGQVVTSLTMPGFDYILAEPYGVVAAIIPWNAPAVSVAMKVFPALAAGNTVVLKPPELTPFAALRIAELAREAGLPEGVLNVVPGTGAAGAALVRHPDVDKVTFTGGGVTAKLVMAGCAETLKPLALELGGKSANLIFADADLDRAVPQSIAGCLANAGQGCVNPTRMLVHESAYDEVVDRILAIVRAVRLGTPFDPNTTMGPVISETAANRIVGVIDRARSEQAGDVLAGGKRAGGALAEGYFVEPTVFGKVDQSSHLAQEEVFGPVLAISTFKDDREALAMANGTRYGLGAYLHTRDIQRAHSFASLLEAGVVYVNSGRANMSPNAPFGGVKQSGFGSEGGRAGINEFIRPKTVFVALQPFEQ